MTEVPWEAMKEEDDRGIARALRHTDHGMVATKEGRPDSARRRRGPLGSEEREEEGGEPRYHEEEEAPKAGKRPTSLFGGHLRRCQGHDRYGNGFVELRSHIEEAEERIKAVQKQVPGRVYGLDVSVNVFDWMLPRRENYAAVKDEDAGRAEQKAKDDERTPKASPRKDAPKVKSPGRGAWGPAKVPANWKPACYLGVGCEQRALPIQLESLQQFVDSSGTYRVEEAGARRGKTRNLKNLEKQLHRMGNEAFSDAVREEMAAKGFELNPKILEAQQEQRRQQQQKAEEKAEESKPGDARPAYATATEQKADPFERAIALMRPDAQTSWQNPVTKLRDTLLKYDDSRQRQRANMAEMMHAMDLDRLPALQRRGKYLKISGASSSVRETIEMMSLAGEMEQLEKYTSPESKAQFAMYKSLMTEDLKSSRRELQQTPVVFFIFDFLQNILQYGEVFTADMFFRMLRDVDMEEYNNPLVQRVVETLAQQLEGVGLRGLKEWFLEHHGRCPDGFLPD